MIERPRVEVSETVPALGGETQTVEGVSLSIGGADAAIARLGLIVGHRRRCDDRRALRTPPFRFHHGTMNESSPPEIGRPYRLIVETSRRFFFPVLNSRSRSLPRLNGPWSPLEMKQSFECRRAFDHGRAAHRQV